MQRGFAELVESRLQHVAPIRSDCVLVGGSAVGLVLTDPGAAPARPTNDIDLVIAVDSRIEYEVIASRLRTAGLSEDSTSNVICRWRHTASGCIYDVMPTSASIFGFGNEWYDAAFAAARELTLLGGLVVRCATAPYLIAMKFAAFDSRGGSDHLASHDMNDIVALVDGVPTIVDDVTQAGSPVRDWLATRFLDLIDSGAHHDAILGYLMPEVAFQQRRPHIEQRMRDIAQLE